MIECSTGIGSKPIGALHSAARYLGATRCKKRNNFLKSVRLPKLPVYSSRIVRLEMYKE